MSDFERARKYLRPRRGRRSTALRKDFILRRGEIFFEVPESGIATGPGKMVMGDGIHKYSELPYYSEAAGDVKADKVLYATDGDIAGLDATGNLTDSGIRADNVVTKLHTATPSDICVFDSNGNIADSNISVYEVTKNKAAIQTILNYYGAKNIIPFPYYDEVVPKEGITFTLLGQVIEVNGIVDEAAQQAPSLILAHELPLIKGRYIISGNKDATTQTISNDLFLKVDIYNDGDTSHLPDRTVIETESESIVEIITDTTVVNITLQTTKTIRYVHIPIYPMLRLENANDSNYVEFAYTNRQLTELKQDKKLLQIINVDGTDQTTVEGTLSAINSLAATNKDNVGPLETLETTTKTNVISAINELHSNLGSKTLESLTDVQLTNPVNEQALVYDEASQKWINATAIPSIATVNTVGTVKPDGDTITIDVDGTIHGAAAPYIVSNTAPSDHRPFWIDTSIGGVLKYWNGSAYKPVRFVWD